MRALLLPAVGLLSVPALAGVTINELLPDPEGPDAGKEWVELYNTTDAPVSLAGWRLQSGTSSYAVRHTFGDVSIPARGFLVVGGVDVPFADVIATGLTLGNATSTTDAVRLVRADGVVVDTVLYGQPNTAEWLDDTGAVGTSFAPRPRAGIALARRSDGLDTDQSGEDFVLQPDLTPGAPNPGPLPCELGYIVINEFLPDPPGTDQGQEWVELYNPNDIAIDLGGWVLDASTRSFGGGTPLPSVEIAPRGFLVLGHVGVSFADVELAFTLGNATSNSDGVQLRDCEGVVVDTVIYGSPNSDEWIDDTGEIATSLAPRAGSGVSLARISDGHDTDRSGDDFVTEVAPTPGASNRIVEPVVCEPADGATVVLNELMVNPDGRDDGLEWIELYNPTDEPVRIDGWGISWATNADGVEVINAVLPGGLTVPPLGFFVIGDELVDEADVIVRLRLPNGTNGDGVILYDCEGARVDTVIYGPNNDDGITDDNGEVVDPYVPQVASGASLARRVDGVDTDSAEDWFSANRPTPGASNQGTGGPGTGPRDRGCSCGGRRSGVQPLGMLLLVGLGASVARRDRRGGRRVGLRGPTAGA